MTRPKALGKGLSALLENRDTDITSNNPVKPVLAGSVSNIAVSQIEVNPFQPRQEFDREKLAELAASIESYGIIQPITVRKMGYDRYQIISGERRFRAAQMAGLTEVPVFVRIADDQAMLEMALVENIQRHDLDAIEVALSYQRLIEECGLTQEALAGKVGKKRTTVTNYLRLLRLPAEIQLGIRQGQISMGHARALVSAGSEEEQVALYRSIVEGNLSVRDAEQLAGAVKPVSKTASPSKRIGLTLQHKSIQQKLTDKLGTKIAVRPSEQGDGKIVIRYENEEDLARIAAILQAY
ncbi:MAG: ParB/RepB/Spo0J family partition protein [Cryomorphaceae bacterium]|nr:MAG: ParB/RepB/Spo0J family partition protein [Cryomorphaceae bacterium]